MFLVDVIVIKCVFCSFGPLVQLKKALEDLTELLAEKEELSQRCQELDIQVHFIHTYAEISIHMLAAVLDAASSTAVHTAVSEFAHINGGDAA